MMMAVATLSERFFAELGAQTWRPLVVHGASRLLVPEAPVDLDGLASSLVDEASAPVAENDEPLLDLETLDVAALLQSEGLTDAGLLLSLDWPEGNYSLFVMPANDGTGYITIPGEWEGGTWPWSALAAVEPAEDALMLTEFVCSFIDSRGSDYSWSGCFPTWIEDHWTVEIGALVERSRVEASIDKWRTTARP